MQVTSRVNNIVARTPLLDFIPSNLESRYKYTIQWFAKDQGIKKEIFVENYNNLEPFDLTLTEKGLGKANINLINIDFPIDIEDRVLIFREGERIYSGLVASYPVNEGGKVKIDPIIKKLENTRIQGTFTGTRTEIIQQILEDRQDDTRISFNEFYIDQSLKDITDTFTFTFNNIPMLEALEDVAIGGVSDLRVGVNANDIFFALSLDTEISKEYLNTDDRQYQDISIKFNSNNINVTRGEVRQKSGTNTISLGFVGFESTPSYPPISLEDSVGIKEGVIEVSEGLTTDEGLDSAYNFLLSQVTPLTYEVKGCNPAYHLAKPLQKLKFHNIKRKRLHTISDCDELSNDFSEWSGPISLSSDAYEGNNSIKYVGSSSLSCYLTFNSTSFKFTDIEKIVFMVKANKIIDNVRISTLGFGNFDSNDYTFWFVDDWFSKSWFPGSSELDDSNFSVDSNVWKMIEFPVTADTFNQICFEQISNEVDTEIYIDRVQFYMVYGNIFEANVTQAKYSVSEVGENIDITLNKNSQLAFQDLFNIERKVNNIEGVLVT